MRHTQYDALQKLERIYKNSLPAIKLLIKRREFDTLDELTALVAHVEVTRGSIGPLAPLTVNEVINNLGAKPRVPGQGPASPSSFGHKRQEMSKTRLAEATPGPKIANPEEVCRRCARPGHFAAQCQNPVQLFCWNCGTMNTKTKDCCPPTTTKLNIVYSPTAMPDKVNHPLKVSEPIYNGRSFKCTIDTGTRSYPAIIDTGSWHSYVNDKVCQELPYNTYHRESCHFNVLFADGTRRRMESALQVQYEFQGELNDGKLLILKGSLDPFILGMDFLSTIGVTLNLGAQHRLPVNNTRLRMSTVPETPDTLMPEQLSPESEGLKQTPHDAWPSEQLSTDNQTSGQQSEEFPTRPPEAEPKSHNAPEEPERVRKFLKEEVAKSAETQDMTRVGKNRLFMKDEISIRQRPHRSTRDYKDIPRLAVLMLLSFPLLMVMLLLPQTEPVSPEQYLPSTQIWENHRPKAPLSEPPQSELVSSEQFLPDTLILESHPPEAPLSEQPRSESVSSEQYLPDTRRLESHLPLEQHRPA